MVLDLPRFWSLLRNSMGSRRPRPARLNLDRLSPHELRDLNLPPEIEARAGRRHGRVYLTSEW